MKNILCYLGILVLVILGALPPVLRAFYNPEENKEEVIVESFILLCKNDTYMTTTSYEGDDVKKIAIKKIIANQEEKEEENDETSPDQTEETSPIESEETEPKGMDLIFDTLKSSGKGTYNTVEDGEILTFDFKTSKYQTIDLSNLKKAKEEQKKYYETLNLVCNINKL